MCGLCGIALHDGGRSPSEEVLGRMARTLVHRGPDDEGLLVRGPIGLGFRRLSIIDVEGGHQPIYNEDGDVAIALNGEIYNFRELRRELEERGHRFRTRSDVETVVHLYEEVGPAAVERLVGMFALSIADWRDPDRPRLLLARDALGIKPLYWADTGEALLWGSEPKALLAEGSLPRRLRGPALLDYLVQGWTGGSDAAWEGVRRLPPGCRLTWSPGEETKVERFWDLPLEAPREPADRAEILDQIDRAVRDRLVADVPLGAFLSGGIDSTAVVTSMAAAREEPVVACSVGFREKSHDELDTARETARRLGAIHHTEILDPDPVAAAEVLPWHFDEPLADPSTVPTWLVSKMAREHVTVALSGDGGDEVFGGYRRYVFDVAENRLRRRLGRPVCSALGAVGGVYPKLDWAPRFLRAKSVLTGFGTDPARAYFSSLCQMSRDEALALLAPDLRAALAEHDPFHAFAELYERPTTDEPLYRATYADFHTWLPDRLLVKTDRASMAVSLEVRVPMLDHRLVGALANLPTAEKIRAGRGKHALRRALRGRVPDSVLDGTKRGFDTPLRAWTRGPLDAALAEAVESLPEDWFDRAVLRERLAENRSGRRDRSLLLWTVWVLEQWRRRHGVTGIAA